MASRSSSSSLCRPAATQTSMNCWADFHREHCEGKEDDESIGELTWQGHRLIVARRPEVAQEMRTRRDEKIAALTTDADGFFEKLDGQDDGRKYRGRKLSDGGVMARFYRAVSEARLAHIIKVDLTSDTFYYVLDTRALERARMIDGKLLLVTNVPADEFSPEEVVARYKALSDIEHGFRVLKSEIEIAPVYHRLPDRIRAHALICFLALVLYRVLRMRLKARDHRLSPQRAIADDTERTRSV